MKNYEPVTHFMAPIIVNTPTHIHLNLQTKEMKPR
jgi:hypothetical protein